MYYVDKLINSLNPCKFTSLKALLRSSSSFDSLTSLQVLKQSQNVLIQAISHNVLIQACSHNIVLIQACSHNVLLDIFTQCIHEVLLPLFTQISPISRSDVTAVFYSEGNILAFEHLNQFTTKFFLCFFFLIRLNTKEF